MRLSNKMLTFESSSRPRPSPKCQVCVHTQTHTHTQSHILYVVEMYSPLVAARAHRTPRISTTGGPTGAHPISIRRFHGKRDTHRLAPARARQVGLGRNSQIIWCFAPLPAPRTALAQHIVAFVQSRAGHIKAVHNTLSAVRTVGDARAAAAQIAGKC